MGVDYSIIGAGLFGSVFARLATDAGFKCVVYEARDHVAGNCYTERSKDGYDIHKYGPHIFHTNSEKVWKFVNEFSNFNGYRHQQVAKVGDRFYQFPINHNTLAQVFGEEDTLNKFYRDLVSTREGSTIEDWCVRNIGPTLYELLIKSYVQKQWGREASQLPDSIIRRLKFKFDRNNDFYADRFQGIPSIGYTQMVENMLHGIPVLIKDKVKSYDTLLKNTKRKIVYTGKLDEFFNYTCGRLEWRTMEFRDEVISSNSPIQPKALVTYNDLSSNNTRSTEHWHFNPSKDLTESVITYETPCEWAPGKEPMYPVINDKNLNLSRKYLSMVDKNRFIFGGRLATYKYYDMDQVIAAALSAWEKEIT